jgi:two-component system OmpR family sensor kinase
MTLRLRLVLALVLLTLLGLGIFGWATYTLYARAEYARLEDQMRDGARALRGPIREAAGVGDDDFGPRGGRGGPDDRPGDLPFETYGELRDGAGRVVGPAMSRPASAPRPALPDRIPAPGPEGVYFQTGSVDGSDRWLVHVTPDEDHGAATGQLIVLAVPLAGVQESLSHLVLIETVAGATLLAVLAGGSWIILRHGLRPLEHMATSARSITAGDLSQRVEPAEDHTEVGQLGLALNTMLTEIEEAFREREATERKLRQFLADASHELRTPLTSIQGFAELFRVAGAGDGAQPVDLPVVLRRIEEESARMKGLVEDLLLLARLDETRPLERVPVDLAVIAADACSDAVAQAPDRPVSLDAPAPVVVLGDPDHLRQAVANLVTNALRHTPAGTPVEVRAAVGEGRATVEVRDHGPGLDDEARAHVFDRFWQADRARVGAGAGLGLAIVAGIAAEHGGEASVENVEPHGARFRLTIPLTAAR